jgi:hypothetical protein
MSPSRARKGATTQSHFKLHSGTSNLRVSKSPPPSDLGLRAASDTVGSWFDASAMYHTCTLRLGHAGGAQKKCLAHAVPCQRSLAIGSQDVAGTHEFVQPALMMGTAI